MTHLAGNARFEAPGRVVVTPAEGSEQLVTADKVIIATGSAPMRIPGWPDDPAIVCTSDEAVHWTDLPKRLLIVGRRRDWLRVRVHDASRSASR